MSFILQKVNEILWLVSITATEHYSNWTYHSWDTSAVTATSRLTLRNKGEADVELTSICTRRKLWPIRWGPAYYKTQGWSHGRQGHRASGHHLSLLHAGSSPNSPLPSLLFYKESMPTKLQPEKRVTNAKSMFQVPKSLTQLRGHKLSQVMIFSLQTEPHGSFPEPPQPLINWPFAWVPAGTSHEQADQRLVTFRHNVSF